MIYGPVKVNGIWRQVYSTEPYTLYDEPDMIKLIKVGRLSSLQKAYCS